MDYTKLLDSYGSIIESDLKEQFAQLITDGRELPSIYRRHI